MMEGGLKSRFNIELQSQCVLGAAVLYYVGFLCWCFIPTPSAAVITFLLSEKGLVVGTWFLAIATIVLAYTTIKGVRESLRTEALARFSARWDEPVFREQRTRTAAWLRQNGSRDLDADDDHGIADIMDFFEELGALLRVGRLDLILVWQAFDYAAVGWWNVVGHRYVLVARETDWDRSFYSEYEFLVEELQKVTVARGQKVRIWSEAELTAFLRYDRIPFAQSLKSVRNPPRVGGRRR